MKLNIETEVNEKFIESVANHILKDGNKTLLKAITEKVIDIKKKEFDFDVPYNFSEVIKITKTSRSTLKKHIKSGLLKCSEEGYHYKFSKENINNYLKAIKK